MTTPRLGLELDPEPGVRWRRKLSGDRIVDLSPLVLGAATLKVGPASPAAHAYDHVYTYASSERALVALITWDGEGEPRGWIRHQPSDRRRPDGDPALEYVEP